MKAEAGSSAGRWTLVERLGAGGMGEVWRAEGPGSAPAALKLLRAGEAEPAARRRFEREAAALMALRHPCVVQALDFGQTETGALYLAMELLEGEGLDERLRREHALAPVEAVRIVRAATAGLGAAHAAGIVHRDVKPGNLFLCRNGVVKVIDFGLALATDASTQTRLTQVGTFIGTLSYTAPEQVTSEWPTDSRTDVWALGAVLHHVLSGHPPFWAGGSHVGEMFRIVTEPPGPLPASVPPALQAVVRRALMKQPGDRWESMAALAAALDTLPPDVAAADTAPERPGRAGIAAGRGAARAREVAGPGAYATEADGRTGHAAPAPRAGMSVADTVALGPVATRSALAEEVRVVSAVVAAGVHGQAAAEVFRAEVQRQSGVAAVLRDGRGVGVLGGAEWLGDEPERAVRAARAIATRLPVATVGVGTGKAVRSGDLSGGAVTGAAVIAAEDAAVTAGSVGVCPETTRRLRGAFEIRDGRVISETARPESSERSVGGVSIPMLGRDRELRRLTEMVGAVAADARACAVLVIGPPGIGKSRLRSELRRRLESDPDLSIRYLEGRGEAARAFVSHAVIAGMLRARASLPEGTPADDGRARIEALVASASLSAPRARTTADFIGELLGLPFPDNDPLLAAREDPRLMADRIRLALGDLFEGWAEQGPVVLAIEDLHWADRPSVALLDFLLLRLDERPFAVVATARPEVLRDRADALPGAERIELRDLGARDVASIVERILGRPEPSVVERAAGNPYFAEELALALREGATPAAALPLTIEGAVQARLDQIDPREKDLLKRASVIGRRFWSEAAIALGEPEAPRLLGALRQRDLVVPRADTRLHACTEWVFRHAVVQEVAYGMLTDPQRVGLHRLAALWLAARGDSAPEEVAEHHERAGDRASARPFWIRAVEEADRRADPEDVIGFSDRVLAPDRSAEATLDPDAEDPEGALDAEAPAVSPEVAGLRLKRVTAWAWLGRPDREEEELRALDALAAQGLLDDALQGALARCWSFWFRQRGRLEESLEAAEPSVAAADRAGDPTPRATTRATLAETLALAGRLQQAAELADEAIAIARPSRARGLAIALQARGFVAALMGDAAAALAFSGEALAEHEQSGHVRKSANVAADVGAHRQALGDFEGARRVLEDGLAAARSLGIRITEGWAAQNLGLVRARLGDLPGALEALAVALERGRELSQPRLVLSTLAYRAVAFLEAGDVERALTDARASVDGAPSLDIEPIGRAVLAAALVAAGRPADALVECARGLELRAAQGSMAELEAELLLAHHDALAALGRDTEARVALAEATAAIQARAARIADPSLRRGFMENIPAHRRLQSLGAVP